MTPPSPYDALQLRIKTILPATYRDCYEDVQPVSMGSAGLKYTPDGQVAWNEIWTTFCDLAMAGGPPHKGKLLEPATPAAIEADPSRHQAVLAEICRGIALVTELAVQPSPSPGWVQVECADPVMASWLLRAITMENVAARAHGVFLELPAGPAYRIEKEIKNVITVIAKTCHYWVEHMWPSQEAAIGELFAAMAVERPLLEPAPGATATPAEIEALTGLSPTPPLYPGWLGLECPSVPAAVWLIRALVATNILARREGTVLYVPLNPSTDSQGRTLTRTLAELCGFAKDHHFL
jgi:sirohydrochlorin cobaltochelatase